MATSSPRSGSSLVGEIINWNEVEVVLNDNFGVSRMEQGKHYYDKLKDFDLWFVISGKGTLKLKGKAITPLRRGIVTIFRPGDAIESYSDPGEEGTRIYYFHFNLLHKKSRKPLACDTPKLKDIPHSNEILGTTFFEACCMRIAELLGVMWQSDPIFERAARDQAHRIFRGLFVELGMSRALQKGDRMNGLRLEHFRKVSELISHIEEHPADFLNVTEISRKVGYNPDHLTRIVKTITGRSLKQIIVNARIEYAKHLLLHTSMPLKVIAHTLGYTEVYYFLRQFRKETARTPSEFRRGDA